MSSAVDSLTVCEAAKAYFHRGWEPIPLQPKGKNPIGKWAEPVQWTNELIAEKFGGGCNVGVALGDRSGRLVDIDFDWPEAAQIAGRMMPNMLTFGRQSSPGSHRLVRTVLPKGRLVYELPKTVAERHKADRAMVLEVRGNGHQTMFPPSTHPTGEVVRWESDTDEVPSYPADELIRRAGICAFLAVVVRFYPRVQGDRDNICMALTGALVNADVADEEIDKAVTMVAEIAGDEEYGKRGGKAAATRAKAEANENIWGLPELCKRLEIGEAENEL